MNLFIAKNSETWEEKLIKPNDLAKFIKKNSSLENLKKKPSYSYKPWIKNEGFIFKSKQDFVKETVKYLKTNPLVTAWIGDYTIEGLILQPKKETKYRNIFDTSSDYSRRKEEIAWIQNKKFTYSISVNPENIHIYFSHRQNDQDCHFFISHNGKADHIDSIVKSITPLCKKDKIAASFLKGNRGGLAGSGEHLYFPAIATKKNLSQLKKWLTK